MVRMTTLTLENFKRYSGKHVIPLSGEQGCLTLIAAQNGIGKTTTLDSIHIAIHGKRGFRNRYPKKRFDDWLMNAYSVDSQDQEDHSMTFALDLECPIHGQVHVERTFWLLEEEDGGIIEEFGVTIDGRPLEIEEGERRTDVSERWLEAFMPLAVMRRFLVDGERLAELDPRNVDNEMAAGIDDLLGIGVLDRLNHHLNTLRRKNLSGLAPEEEDLFELEEQFSLEIKDKTELLSSIQLEIDDAEREIEELKEIIQMESRDLGSKDSKLRIDYNVKNSEVSSSKAELKKITEANLPFIIAGLPTDLEKWSFTDVKEAANSSDQASENLNFINLVLETIEIEEEDAVREIAEELANRSISEIIDSPLSSFSSSQLEVFRNRYAEIKIGESTEECAIILNKALVRLESFKAIELQLRVATEGLQIAEAAEKMKKLGVELGGFQTKKITLTEEIGGLNEGMERIENRIEKMRSRMASDSLINRKHVVIDTLKTALNLLKERQRALFAEPLEESFQEGFELLSRKADRIKNVSIDPSTYHVSIEMDEFPGNWLERDLSATEKQHVGLSLLYALRKLSGRAFPVVVDTPVSRMDREHKQWSVKRFYPNLSHQTIILATSDDLADGLFEELADTGQVGLGLEISEVSNNSITINEEDLSIFFGGN